MAGYAPLPQELQDAILTVADLTVLFPGFRDHAMRQTLYARGFPHPIYRAHWSTAAVRQWLLRVGENSEGVAPPTRAQRLATQRAQRRIARLRHGSYAPAVRAVSSTEE